MTRRTLPPLMAGLSIGVMLAAGPALAQQITGVPGSPEATTTIDGRYLPSPPQPFGARSSSTPSSRRPIGRRASCRPRTRRTSS